MVYNVQITASAEKDLDEILAYIVEELSNPQAAEHLLDEITKTFHVLAENPMIYPACTQPLLQRFRKVVVMRYVIIYRVDDTTVYVERLFSQLEDYVHKL